jgi:lysylphosphatidylglycerol synthetase-like protein (DUF2156 family)
MRSSAARLPAWLLAAAGLLLLWPHPLPGAVIPGAPLPALDRAGTGALLLVLAYGLAGRRRLAWQVTLVLVALVALAPPYRPGRLLPPALVAVVLLLGRPWFVTRPDPARVRAALAVAVGAVTLGLSRAVWMAAWHGEPVGRAAHAALPVPPAAANRSTQVFVLIVLAAVVVALGIALAAAPPPAPSGAAERARVRALARDPAAPSLAPFAARADKTIVFAPDGSAAIGYRVRFGVALAGGDPAGPAAAAGAAIDAFAELCAIRGWRPAVLGSAAADAAAWRRAGLRRAVGIGDEAVLELDSFRPSGRRMRNVRQAARRAGNAGVRVRTGPLTPELIPRLEPVLRDWLHGRAERGFAMNLDGLLTPRPDVLYAVAFDAAGEAVAFARFAVVAGGRVLSLDVAPRRRDAPNGVVERLILAVADEGRAAGAEELSLNFAGLRRVYAGEVRGSRALLVPLHALDRWIELRSLWRFTDKFHPAWRPRELRLRSWLELVPVATAALTAEFGARPPVPPAADADLRPGLTEPASAPPPGASRPGASGD